MDHDDVPAAAQISQADIIERQAEDIARLKRQVKKGTEYKQLTKSKLKEAAARLKEYRVRVETLLRAEETLKKQLKDAQNAHEKTKKQHKSALNQVVKPIKHVKNAATQTEAETKVTRSSQTQLSGNVERVNKKTMVDSGVQTVDVMVDTLTSKKRAREHVASTQTQMDQLVPKLSRHPQVGGHNKTTKDNQEPFQLLGGHLTTFPHATSAALDAELAFSDSDGESADTLELGSASAEAGADSGLIAFDAAVTSEIDKELEFSSDEEEERPSVGAEGKTDKAAVGVSLLGTIDAVMQSEIDKELESGSDEEDGTSNTGRRVGTGNIVADKTRTRVESSNTAVGNAAGSLQVGEFDAAVSNEIDKELETSSDEEDDNANKAGESVKGGRDNIADSSKNKHTLMSIDDELDDEFAALDSDSEPENHEKKPTNSVKDGGESSSSSDSSDSDSSDSSDSDSDEDDPMIGGANKKSTVVVKETQADSIERGASSSLIDSTPVVLTTPVGKKPVTALEDVYSPIVEMDLPSQTPEPLHLDTIGVAVHTKGSDESNVAVASPAQKSIPASPSSQPTKTGDGDTIAVTDIPASSNDANSPISPTSKQPEVLTLSDKEDKETALDSHATSDTSQPLDPIPLDSAMTTTEPGELGHPESIEAKHTATRSPTEDSALGRVRKADEANLDDSQATAPKKAKVSKPVDEEMSGGTDNGRAKKKPKGIVETKDERRIKKSLTTFKQAIGLGKGEEADKEYARRTITVLVNQSSRFVDTHLDHVMTLCQVLSDTFRDLEVSPIAVVRGALGVFRTPRSRRLMQDSKLGVSWLCNQVLIKLMCSGDDSLTMSPVDECLLHLRRLLVEEQTNLGDFLTVNNLQVQVATQQINVSHDKVFLAHICALHTHLCQSTKQLSRSRVLLFDIVRDNPNIRGLYFAMVMIEIYPAILEREFDQHCAERQLMLKDTLQQAFIVISGIAASKEELLLHQSSITMLHRIADAIQMPELEEVNGNDPHVPRRFVEKLFNKVRAQDADYFELAKSLEVCTAVYGLDLVTEVFSIERCRELFSTGNVEVKSGIVRIVGDIAMTIAPKTMDTQTPRTRSEQYVESVIDWLYELLSTDRIDVKSSAEDCFKLRIKCSSVCVDLILEYSASAGLESRRRALCVIVNWFDATPADELIDLPATFLRRLRLAVVAARPQVVPVTV